MIVQINGLAYGSKVVPGWKSAKCRISLFIIVDDISTASGCCLGCRGRRSLVKEHVGRQRRPDLQPQPCCVVKEAAKRDGFN